MTDIATLGLAVDSSQVVKATAALNQFVPAAKAAQGATNPLAQAANVAAVAADQHATSIRGQRLVLRGLAGDLALLSPAMGGVAAQAALLYVDNAHLIGGFTGLKNAVLSILTPTNVLIGSLVGVAAAAYLINSSWKTTALQFDDTAKAVGGTISQLRALASEASIKEIPTDEFLKSSEKFASNIYDAKAGMGQLAMFLRANGGAAKDFESTLDTVARLVRQASGDSQKQFAILTSAGLPATLAWVRYMTDVANKHKDAATAGQDLNGVEQKLVDQAREFDEAWNRTWNAFATAGRSAFLTVKAGLNELSDIGVRMRAYFNPGAANSQVQNRFGDFGGNTSPALQSALDKRARQLRGEKEVVDPNQAAHAIGLEQQRISILGQTATVEQQVRAVELSVAAARMQGVNVTQKELDTLKQLAYEQALGLTAIHAQTDALKVETATIGMDAGAAAEYKAVQDALNQAKRDHKVLTDQNIADLKNEASALGRAAAAADEARFEFDVFSGSFRDFETNLRNGQGVWEAFGNAGKSALGKIADKLADMASRSLWNLAFGGNKSGGIGGLLGSLFGGGGGPSMVVGGAGSMAVPTFHSGHGPGEAFGSGTRTVNAGIFDTAPRFHDGVGPNEIAAVIRDDESVLTPAQMRGLAPSSKTPPIVVHFQNDFRGAAPEAVAAIGGQLRLLQKQVSQLPQTLKQTAAYRPSTR